MLGRSASLWKAAIFLRGQLDRAEIGGGERAAGFFGGFSHGHATRHDAVDLLRIGSDGIPTTSTHVVDDAAHPRLQCRIAALLRPGECGTSPRLVQRVPFEASHHSIIFSIGMTRIAEAPAAFNFCSVSQNTDSWQTA